MLFTHMIVCNILVLFGHILMSAYNICTHYHEKKTTSSHYIKIRNLHRYLFLFYENCNNIKIMNLLLCSLRQDEALLHGRTSRADWGPGLTLLHCKGLFTLVSRASRTSNLPNQQLAYIACVHRDSDPTLNSYI